jgi:hypothetical protein
MKQKMLLWLYRMFHNKPAVPFTPQIIAHAIDQPLDKVQETFHELEEVGAIKKASKIRRDSFRMTLDRLPDCTQIIAAAIRTLILSHLLFTSNQQPCLAYCILASRGVFCYCLPIYKLKLQL